MELALFFSSVLTGQHFSTRRNIREVLSSPLSNKRKRNRIKLLRKAQNLRAERLLLKFLEFFELMVKAAAIIIGLIGLVLLVAEVDTSFVEFMATKIYAAVCFGVTLFNTFYLLDKIEDGMSAVREDINVLLDWFQAHAPGVKV